jgi:hypothetical protein
MTRRVFISCTRYAQTGARYRVTDEDGRVLVASSRVPEFDAARALLAKGVTGRLEIWWASAAFPAMRLDIETAAGLTVVETDAGGLKMIKWKPGAYNSAAIAGSQRVLAAGMGLEA